MPTIHLVIRHFADVNAAEEARLLALLTDHHEDNIARHPALKRRQLLARAWRRELLALALGVAPEQLRFLVAEQGKPYLADGALSFNIAHSDEAFVLAWSDAQIDIGIDVEDRAKQRRARETLAKRSFHPDEQRVWQAAELNPEQAQIQWLTTWTRKEAILKAHGMGIRLDLHELNTENSDDIASHPLLGQWRYQSLVWAQQVVSVAWHGNLTQVTLIQEGL